jgi:RNA polymerase sigma-B factor
MKALDGFDPDKGLQFSTYATPTILGELKRHFRDRTWTVRVPRRLHDLYLQLQRARDDLAQEKGRSPTVAELAGRIGATEEDVIEAIDASEVRALTSLDAAVAGRDEAVHVGAVDDAIDDIERRMTVPALLEGLTPFEREVVRLRFYEALTQSEIAHRLDTNQMQISRTLARSLRRLRAMTNEE